MMPAIAPVAVILVAEKLRSSQGSRRDDLTQYGPVYGAGIRRRWSATSAFPALLASGVTTYAENIGVMAVTKLYDAGVCCCCRHRHAVWLLPKFGALIQTIPPPVIGGVQLLCSG
ncbi:solute carrier family 23 protein [Escherichia coli]